MLALRSVWQRATLYFQDIAHKLEPCSSDNVASIVLSVQDLVHFMISAHVEGDDAKEVTANVKLLASKWLWWWEAQKPDHAPTTLYWTFD